MTGNLPNRNPQSSRHDKHRRIEIVHESLLSQWPRLVRWRAQDEEGALLRDQLHQAAQLWQERGRPDDLLWTDTSFREFELWRERYEGGLTDQEESFAIAMAARAMQKRRRRRTAIAAIVVLALGIAAATSSLWRRSEIARRQAVASKLVALGRSVLESNHTAALAYASKSLEVADSPEARRFALEILWSAPPARLLHDTGSLVFAFSPDGRWLSAGRTQMRLTSDDGRSLEPVGRDDRWPWTGWRAFSIDNDIALRLSYAEDKGETQTPVLERWQLPDLRELPVSEWDDRVLMQYTARGLLGLEPRDSGRVGYDVLLWPSPRFPQEVALPESIGTWFRGGSERRGPWGADPGGEHFAWARGREVLLRELDFSAVSTDALVTEHDADVRRIAFSPTGDLLATSDTSEKEIRVFSIAQGEISRLATLTGGDSPDPLSTPAISPDGTRLAMVSRAEKAVYLWDLATPLDARPLVLAKKDEGEGFSASFHPDGQWLATLHGPDIAFWPLTQPYSRVVAAWKGTQWLGDLAFSPDSQWLAGCAHGAPARIFPLAPGLGEARNLPGGMCRGLAFDPSARYLLRDGPLSILSLEDGSETMLEDTGGWFYGLAFDSTGRRAAAAPSFGVRSDQALLRAWDLETGESWQYDLRRDCPKGLDCLVSELRFLPDGRIITGGPGGLRRWDLEGGSFDWMTEPDTFTDFDLTSDGRYLLTAIRTIDEGRNEEEADAFFAVGGTRTEFRWFDLETGTERKLERAWFAGTYQQNGGDVAIGRAGDVFVVGSADGAVHVGRISGGEDHLLLGHSESVFQVAVSPDGRWIASRSEAEIRLWPMPDLDKPPLHTLPHDELLAKLRSFTNLRVVEDPESATGWTTEVGPFPGWKEVPTW